MVTMVTKKIYYRMGVLQLSQAQNIATLYANDSNFANFCLQNLSFQNKTSYTTATGYISSSLPALLDYRFCTTSAAQF